MLSGQLLAIISFLFGMYEQWWVIFGFIDRWQTWSSFCSLEKRPAEVLNTKIFFI